MKFLIVTADDFGLHDSVNEAVERASRAGTLTSASLMVTAPAMPDAVRRARGLTNLRVGLHIVLADGRACLSPEQIPALADRSGVMSPKMFVKSVGFFFRPSIRKQLEAEIRAQFAAFAQTGLRLDHVNVHKHFHLHPTVLDVLLRVGRDYGRPPVRLPAEPLWFAAKYGSIKGALMVGCLRPWIAVMKRRLKAEGVLHNDVIFGLSSTGCMDEPKLLAAIASLRPGITEIYLHPAVDSGIAPTMSEYRHIDELTALLSPRVRASVFASGAAHGGFLDVLHGRSNR